MFAGDLPPADVMDLIDRWCSRAQRRAKPNALRVLGVLSSRREINGAMMRDPYKIGAYVWPAPVLRAVDTRSGITLSEAAPDTAQGWR